MTILILTYSFANSSRIHLQILHSPMGSRCTSLHDPRVAGPYPSWLELCTKPKRSSLCAIPDRLYHDRDVSRFQDNPIIDYHNWKSYGKTQDPFGDSYDLITAGLLKQSDQDRAVTVTKIHKLAIVRAMEAEKTEDEINFLYSNKMTADNEPCLVLKTRYFRLAHLEAGSYVRIEDIVQEVPATDCLGVIQANETVFESKGMANCNRSILFYRRVKGDQELKSLGRHKLMQSKDDCEEGRLLIDSILKHCIQESLTSIGCQCDCNTDKAVLRADFLRLQMSGRKWLWPVHSDRHKIFGKIYEEYVATEYKPRRDGDSRYNLCDMWATFAHEMGRESKQDKPKGRLDVFRSLSAKRAKSKREEIPHIKNSSNTKAISCSSEEIWKELLLGDDGPYKNALHMFQSSSDTRF
jgi:hypothetical protein